MTDTIKPEWETTLTVEQLLRVLREVELQTTDGNSLYLVQLLVKTLEDANETKN